jgi:hypothetical protein
VEVCLGPQGLAAGGALELIWMDSAHFADSSRMKPMVAGHDVTVSCPGDIPFTVEHTWLPRCQDGQAVVCRAEKPVPSHTIVAVTFGAAGRWRLGPFVHSYPLRVYEDVDASGLFRIIPEDHALRCVAGEPARITATLGPADANGDHPLWINVWDEYSNTSPAIVTASVAVPGQGEMTVTLDTENASREIRLPAKANLRTQVCHVEVPALGLQADSNPTPRLPNLSLNLYFGEIHCHTALSDGMRSLDDLYTFARDAQRLDFAAATDHESHIYGYNLLPDAWPLVRDAARRYCEPGRFVTLLGYEWSAPVKDLSSGHHNVYYRDDDGRLFTSSNPEISSLEGLLRALRKLGRPALVIPHHPVACKNAAGVPEPSLTVGWRVHDPQFIRLVEIYSKWGCSECVPSPFRPLSFEAAGHSVLDALGNGYRLGFTGGSDDHTAMPGSLHAQDGKNLRYPSSGLVAVWAPELTREAIFDALYARRCYATSGPRIVLDFSVNSHPMGQEFVVEDALCPRHIRGTVIGTDRVQSVEIVRSGEIWRRVAGNGSPELTFQVEDVSHLSAPTYYYARVIQADDERAWSSPVWVDLSSEESVND